MREKKERPAAERGNDGPGAKSEAMAEAYTPWGCKVKSALDHALAAAKRGWSVFPVQAKIPFAGFSWPRLSSNNPSQVEAWAAQYPGCNWAVDCGKSGLAVLDLDVKVGAKGRESLAALVEERGQLPATFTVSTPSGGTHRYFQGDCRSKNGFRPGLDLKGVGGYVLLPGSTIDGREYRVEHDAPLAPVPDWLVQVVGERAEKAPDAGLVLHEADHEDVVEAAAWLAHEAPRAVVGSRDNVTFLVAAELRSRYGLGQRTTEALMVGVWLPLCDESGDWSAENVAAKVRSAYGGSARLAQGAEHPAVRFAGVDLPEERVSIYSGLALESLRCAERGRVEPPARKWLFSGGGALPLGEVGFLAGQGGAGKTLLAMQIAASVASGVRCAPFTFEKTGPALLILTEDDQAEVDRRLHRIRREHAGIVLDDLLAIPRRKGSAAIAERDRNGNLRPTQGFRDLAALVREARPALLVLDPLGKVAAQAEEANATGAALVEFLEELAEEGGGATVLALAHVSKLSTGSKAGAGKRKSTVADDLETALSVEALRGASSLSAHARWVGVMTILTDAMRRKMRLSARNAAAFAVPKTNYGPRLERRYFENADGYLREIVSTSLTQLADALLAHIRENPGLPKREVAGRDSSTPALLKLDASREEGRAALDMLLAAGQVRVVPGPRNKELLEVVE